MSDAIIKWKINVLYGTISKMNSANSKLEDAKKSIENLKKVFGDNIKINDAIAYQDYPNNAYNIERNVQGNVTGKIIPSLYYRINEFKKKLGD